MKAQTEIKFRHKYRKLSADTFTTVRGKSQFTRCQVGGEMLVITPDEKFVAVVEAKTLEKISNMDVAFLKADAEYGDFKINSRQDFVDLLNSFRAPLWTRVTLDSEMTVLRLRRVGP